MLCYIEGILLALTLCIKIRCKNVFLVLQATRTLDDAFNAPGGGVGCWLFLRCPLLCCVRFYDAHSYTLLVLQQKQNNSQAASKLVQASRAYQYGLEPHAPEGPYVDRAFFSFIIIFKKRPENVKSNTGSRGQCCRR